LGLKKSPSFYAINYKFPLKKKVATVIQTHAGHGGKQQFEVELLKGQNNNKVTT